MDREREKQTKGIKRRGYGSLNRLERLESYLLKAPTRLLCYLVECTQGRYKRGEKNNLLIILYYSDQLTYVAYR